MQVTRKSQMYAMLSAGDFGNTIPQFYSVEEWAYSPDSSRYKLWGVRSAKQSMHPACRLNCPSSEVAAYADKHFADGPNISMMVDAVAQVTAWLEIWRSPTGLYVQGIENPPTWYGWNWRNSMNDPQRLKRWENTAARNVLARNLNENSFQDLHDLLDRYDDHVVELSALNRCIGTIPHRNAVVWEVRLY